MSNPDTHRKYFSFETKLAKEGKRMSHLPEEREW